MVWTHRAMAVAKNTRTLKLRPLLPRYTYEAKKSNIQHEINGVSSPGNKPRVEHRENNDIKLAITTAVVLLDTGKKYWYVASSSHAAQMA